MERKKHTPSPTEVGHGCLDCVSRDVPMSKLPCSRCKNWSGWNPSQKYLDRMALRKRMERESVDGRKRK